MTGARPVDGARASSCWVVRFGDTEKNFPSKASAIAFLRARTKDTRITPVTVRRGPGAYVYYGPGRATHVLKADIDKVSFASLKARARKPLFDGANSLQVFRKIF